MTPRRTRPPGPTQPAVLVTRGLVVLAGALAAGLTAAPPAAAAPGSDVDPAVLTFGEVAPGDTVYRETVLRADPDAGPALVAAGAYGTGSLTPYLTTSVQWCAVPWSAGVCTSGATTLVDTPVTAGGTPDVLDVAVPASGSAYLRVGVSVRPGAPARSSASITYLLTLVGDDLAPDPSPAPSPTPSPDPAPTPGATRTPTPAGPTGPAGPTTAPSPGPDESPDPGSSRSPGPRPEPGSSAPPGGAPSARPPHPGSLAVTGADVLATGLAALALTALGLTLRQSVRRRDETARVDATETPGGAA